jgi:hypothetical protein
LLAAERSASATAFAMTRPSPTGTAFPELAHLLAPRSIKSPVVGEGHHTPDFADGHVAERSIVEAKYCLAAGHPVDAHLHGLDGLVEVVPRMAWIFARTRPAVAVQPITTRS